jgi:hypothetical protein
MIPFFLLKRIKNKVVQLDKNYSFFCEVWAPNLNNYSDPNNGYMILTGVRVGPCTLQTNHIGSCYLVVTPSTAP